MDCLQPRLKDNVLSSRDWQLLFVTSEADIDSDVKQSNYPIITSPSRQSHFNQNLYFANLNTKAFGKCVLYCDVTTTTMPLVDA